MKFSVRLFASVPSSMSSIRSGDPCSYGGFVVIWGTRNNSFNLFVSYKTLTNPKRQQPRYGKKIRKTSVKRKPLSIGITTSPEGSTCSEVDRVGDVRGRRVCTLVGRIFSFVCNPTICLARRDPKSKDDLPSSKNL